ncbi:MAG: HU family DNA-binding protein [Gammaproteobacteria bacterium]|nr:HU family DNA-binding protein [Gammaproteobacteria bacterium]MCP5135426.1 HU family DNA-binding protein [Gammaproteobacteria bacterium]
MSKIKRDLVEAVADNLSMSNKAAGDAVDAVIEAISDALAQGHSVQIRDFGTFQLRARDARQVRNPRTGEMQTAPARTSIGFKPGQALKERVKEVKPC